MGRPILNNGNGTVNPHSEYYGVLGSNPGEDRLQKPNQLLVIAHLGFYHKKQTNNEK